MKRKIPLILLCILFLGIAGYFVTRLCMTWSDYTVGKETYEELIHYIHLQTPSDIEEKPLEPEQQEENLPQEEAPPGISDDINWPVVDFDALLEINPDVVAWIFIEGTNINYPVVQGEDNSYYLRRLIDGKANNAGTIFLDYRNEKELSDRNHIFYGHRMNDGTMFNQITKYKDQSFYDSHPVCLILTPDGNYKLEFFAGYVTDLNSQAWKMEFASDEEYTQWLENAVAKSAFTSTVEPTAEDRVVTLSTCTYEYDDARFVLVGVLKT